MTIQNKSFTCGICKTSQTYHSTVGGTGYAINHLTGQKVCYDCCAEQDRKFMRDHKKITLYLTREGFYSKITNWPGTLKLDCTGCRTGRHNIAGTRYDVWFVFEGYYWHGVQYGENTQLCHCKQTKQKSA